VRDFSRMVGVAHLTWVDAASIVGCNCVLMPTHDIPTLLCVVHRAVMEAAISSSLSHPNIVQTYTYTIRPMRDNTQQQQQQRVSSSGKPWFGN